jgi:hypothetical protein
MLLRLKWHTRHRLRKERAGAAFGLPSVGGKTVDTKLISACRHHLEYPSILSPHPTRLLAQQCCPSGQLQGSAANLRR